MRFALLVVASAMCACGSSGSGEGDKPSPSDGGSTAPVACKESLSSFTARVKIPTSGRPYSEQATFCAAAGTSEYAASQCANYEGAVLGKYLAYYSASTRALVAVFDYESSECLAGDGERCGLEIGIGVPCGSK